ncbi:MAG: zinc protease [Actinomycetota bacterium]|nr:zinc protease [Actinomycetota bacterium]
MRAGLVLRVGSADEPLVVSGVTHLLEHLALFGVTRPDEHANGQVDQTITSFHRSGNEAEISGFLNTLTRQLTQPPLHRLADERRVLETEAAGWSATAEASLLLWRHGGRGYGVAAFDGVGLPRVDETVVAQWARRFATRGNAVVWFTGPPPAGLRLALFDGPAVPPPSPWGSIQPAFPAYFTGPDGGIALSAVLPAGPAGDALAKVAGARMFDERRTRRAVAYSPQARYRSVTADAAFLTLSSDLAAGRQSDGVRPFLALLEDLAGRGSGAPVAAEEVARWREQFARDLLEPDAALGLVVRRSLRAVLGGTPQDPREMWEAIEAVQPEDVAAAAEAALATALARILSGIRVVREPWRRAIATQLEPLPGPGFAPAGRAPDPREELVVSPGGVTLHRGESHVTVTQISTVAVQAWPDGRRKVISSEGNEILVEPSLWLGGPDAVARIDALWGPDLHVPMPPRRPWEIPAPPAPMTPDAPGAAQAPTTGWASAARLLERAAQIVLFLSLAVYLALVGVTACTMAGGEPSTSEAALDVVIGLAFLAASVGVFVVFARFLRRG